MYFFTTDMVIYLVNALNEFINKHVLDSKEHADKYEI